MYGQPEYTNNTSKYYCLSLPLPPRSPFHRSLLATNGPLHKELLRVTQGPTEALVTSGGLDPAPWLIPQGYDAGINH